MAGLFEGKVALVTGAAGGIGRASALAFAREGAQVAVADVLEKEGRETVNLIEEKGGKAIFVRTDIRNEDEVEALVRKTVEAFGRLDCAHNNAGIEDDECRVGECSEETWARVMSINLRGMFLCMKHEIRQMLEQGVGSIVNTSSGAGLSPALNHPAYTASKHGTIGLTKSAALDYAKKNIRVNVICPGAVNTPMMRRWTYEDERLQTALNEGAPIGRMAQPEEMAEAAIWLCSDEASFVTGHAMSVNAGRGP